MITPQNFRAGTLGYFQEIPFVPVGFVEVYSSPGSVYYVSPCGSFLARVSDHWGAGIGVNNWYLDGHQGMNSYSFKNRYRGREFTGIIGFSDLIPISKQLIYDNLQTSKATA